MKVIIYGNNNYTIDENGNVYNIISKKFLNPYKCKNGYKMVDLHYNGIKSVINLLEFGNDGQIRNYIFRNSKIPYRKFKGFYIKKIIK